MTPEQQMVGYSVEFLFDRNAAELMYFWSGVLLPFVTVGAIIYARAQVVEAKQNTEIIAKQAKATLLLSLEEKWNSADMRAAKKCFVEKKNTVDSDIHKTNSNLNDSAIEEKKCDKFKTLLRELYRDEPFGSYTTLMSMVGFFELLGLLVKRKYVDIKDIADLFGGPILDVGRYIAPHINERKTERGVPNGLFENALYLVDETKKIVS